MLEELAPPRLVEVVVSVVPGGGLAPVGGGVALMAEKSDVGEESMCWVPQNFLWSAAKVVGTSYIDTLGSEACDYSTDSGGAV